jgi:RNA polymerase sigma factor (sigma-70 family)
VAGSSEVSQLVLASAKGNEAAWRELVRRYSPLVMAVTRTYQLPAEDAEDISQTVWLALVEHLRQLREADALPGWLATTTRNACTRHVQQAWRVKLTDPHVDDIMEQPVSVDLDAGILRAELRQALRDGLRELDVRDQQLLRWRTCDPPKPYHEISELLGIPIGSIGPTLRRSLEKLRGTRSMRAYLAASTAVGGGKGGDRRELTEVE